MNDSTREIKQIYELKKDEILGRLEEFKHLQVYGNDEEFFAELAFCILTPQSKAKLCWDAIVKIRKKCLLLKGTVEQIEKELHGVRFKNKKARCIVDARKFFTNNGENCMKSALTKFDDIYKYRAG